MNREAVMEFIPFARPEITDDAIERVVEVLRSGWITTGRQAHQFEEQFAAAVGARHAVSVNSCTAAMHLALEAVGVSPGDEVLLPTMTFAATGEVVRYLGATPVLVDIREEDHNLDPAAVEAWLGPSARVLMPVHFAGQACDLDALGAIAESAGLRMIEDAAHAFPATFRGKSVGSIGDITCFSFYATKTITTGEGGMAVTNNPEWFERMRVMSLHGISKSAWNRYSSEGSWRYEILAPGFKYNLTDIAAALGLSQLARADQMLARRREIAGRYRAAFAAVPALEPLAVHPDRGHAWHLFVVKIREEALRIGRDQFIEELKARSIGTSVHFIPLHLHPYYRQVYGYRPQDLPVALNCYLRSVSLPIYSNMSDRNVDRVIEAVLDIATRFRR